MRNLEALADSPDVAAAMESSRAADHQPARACMQAELEQEGRGA
jgi:hypothetical protein